jgi:hypothetical protein
MAFTMACLNFKKGLKMAFGPLGVKVGVAEQVMSQLGVDTLGNFVSQSSLQTPRLRPRASYSYASSTSTITVLKGSP